MGLDQYLEVREVVSGYDFNKDDKFDALAGLAALPATPSAPSITLSVNVAYWRKANAIHQWFVKNLQGGVDECQEAYVPVEALRTLRDTVVEVLEHPSKAEELLPTQSGFFFGSTDYDEYYTQVLKLTLEQIVPVIDALEANPSLAAYYQSSW